ncbi:MAG: polynucleotide adenylyltransferase PcnB, partial [Betaproteobacteria bacterium]|nr:polynucleotide adenylyltransferase PcnB [Betaproteobacteria bacterium]
MEHLRFRAGFDFLLLRAQAGEDCEALASWWDSFVQADPLDREDLIQRAPQRPSSGARRNTRRRRRVQHASV